MEFSGWKCPECGRILSPFVPSCPYCVPMQEAEVKPKRKKAKIQEEGTPLGLLLKSPEVLNEYLNGPDKGGGV